MPKIFNDPTRQLPRLNEDIWFDVHQDLLLAIANTKKGRDILCIPQEYPEIIKFKKNCLHFRRPDLGPYTWQADFRIGGKWANVIRYRWDLFNSYARYFAFPRVILSTMEFKLPMSAMTRLVRSETCLTLTAYPQPDPETETADGLVLGAREAVWATARGVTTGTADDSSATGNFGYAELDTGLYQINHYFCLFNTASLGDTDTVDSGTQVEIVVSAISFNADSDSLHVVPSTPASNTAIVAGDIDNISYTDYGSKTFASMTADSATYNALSLNASGRTAVSLTGITKFALIDARDLNNNAPTGRNGLAGFFADETGTSKDPKLTVIYSTVAPTAPSGLGATGVSASKTINLAWTDNSSTETSFRVERSTTAGSGFAEIATTAAGATSYSDTDTGKLFDTTYYYRVRAHRSDTDQYSSYTSEASAITCPATPTSPAVVATNDSNTLTVSWTDVSTTETTYRIERSNDGSSGWAEIGSVAAGVATYADTTVGARDTRRYYRVRALRASDTSYSDYSSIVNAYTAPANPSAIVLSVLSNGNIRVAWTDNSSTETTFSIERRSTLNGGVYAEIATDPTSPNDNASGNDDQDYYYRVRAYRSSDGIYSGYLAEDRITNPPAAPSGVQASCTVANASSSKVLLTWKINSTTETGFYIERSTDQAIWSVVTTTDAGVGTYEDTGLTADSTYYYRISAVGADGNSQPSSTASIVVNRTNGAALMTAFEKKVRHFPH